MDRSTLPNFDPVHDVLHYEKKPLDVLFAPKNVALVGATEAPNTVGRTVLWNLISSPFGGTVFPVNPKRSSVLGIKAYPSVADVPEPIDVVVITTPAPTVPEIIRQSVEVGVKGAIIISAGFKEIGPEGAKLEQQILEYARRGNMRIIGPNCLGVMCPISGFNATFASTMAHKGSVGFISQSGALCTAVLDWSLKVNVGFSAFVSVGSMIDVGWGDLIYYLGDDPNTQSIVIYMETIGDARAFLSAAREVAYIKPIIVIKPGRTAGAAKAAASHTGSLTGSDEVLEAAFRRSGVLRVNTIAELFYMADVLAKQPRPRGPRLTILTNAGGPGVIATDALILNGGQLAELSAETMEALDQILPPVWSKNNPIDIIGDASPERYAKALEVAAKDPNSDGLLVILTPQAMTDPTRTAEKLVPYAQNLGKPILASWMGGEEVEEGSRILSQAKIPNFPYPDTAARMFTYMAQYSENLASLYETPAANHTDITATLNKEEATRIIEQARKEGRTLLTEYESKQILQCYHIPIVQTLIAENEEQAVEFANQIGYPVVVKLHSETITHKTDVGGVKLNLQSDAEVRAAFQAIRTSVYNKVGEKSPDGKPHFLGVTVQPMIASEGYELILGSSVDPQFGPVLLFGLGGQLVEVFRDRALGLPPLNATLARRMMEQTKIYTALKGVRGRKPVDLSALEQLLVRFSRLVTDNLWIKEIDINPLLVSPDQIVALDARIVIHDPSLGEDQLPRLAIRPYPTQYVSTWTDKLNCTYTIRPTLPEDEPLLVKFHENLSDRTVYLRFLHPMLLSQRVAHERLARICHGDYDREITLVAEQENCESGERRIVGAGRLSKIHSLDEARFSLLISDLYQGRGIGSELLKRILHVAREEKLRRIEALLTPDNEVMIHLLTKMGFTLRPINQNQLLLAEKTIQP
ncbi:MAG: bifunctional acetate--CoA ligase family protein/GNAT family N-acetyltransferase [Anaerolineales bacterium]|nr:bifunctional acetate--CoA ligase family protein/GNAT family N-acetyltransferase [Anaerolineales bacterium]MDW8160991.1 bifunctional acetate--CoA ligase family protein/GNAT family N-acetyltransferase [Anaerolineales bacterium]